MGRTPLDLVSSVHKEQLQINPKEWSKEPVFKSNCQNDCYLLQVYRKYQARKITGVDSGDSEDD